MASFPPRRPAGVPSGGQFVALDQARAELHLPPDDASWPSVRTETHEWRPVTVYAVPPGVGQSSGPYKSAVPARIAHLADVPLTAETRTLVAAASAEIARFDAEVGAEVAPFASILLRTESVASSRIENLTASAKAIALAEAGDTSRENATVIVANTTAMRAAVALADHLDGAAILEMHLALLGSTNPDWAGRWREVQNWIGGSDYSPHRALFVPPYPDQVPDAIADLEGFLSREDLPPLVQAAVAHAQFETIHPFPDGNGRTGRALVHALLRGKGLTRKVTVPVSAGLLSDTARYFDALTRYRDGDPEPIVAMMSHASYAAINNGRELVSGLHQVRDGWHQRLKARRGSAPRRTADLLLSQPVVDSPMLQRQLGVSDTVALEAIKRLTEVGILTKVSGRVRYRRYAATEVLGQLDAFAARAGRRGGGA